MRHMNEDGDGDQYKYTDLKGWWMKPRVSEPRAPLHCFEGNVCPIGEQICVSCSPGRRLFPATYVNMSAPALYFTTRLVRVVSDTCE